MVDVGRKVLICGNRDWADHELIHVWLEKLIECGYDTVIEGEQRGADLIAREEAEGMNLIVLPFPADWKRYHLGAGPIRNKQMLDEKPDLVVGFHDNIARSKGTRNCVMEAHKRGIQVLVVSHKEVVKWQR